MPIPALATAGLISGAANVIGNLVNSGGSQRENRRSRQFAREMYERQKQDNIAFWNMQNEYNSPQAQMERFQAGGLNPHLIYGQGNSGNSGSISTPDVQSAQFRAPDWGNALKVDGLTMLNAIADLEIKQAQTDNLKAQNGVILQDQLLKAAQTESVSTGQEDTLFDLTFKRKMEDISADARREQLRQLRTSTDLSINRDAREAALNASSINEALERIVSMKQQRSHTRADIGRINESVRQMRKDGVLKDLDIELRKQGINPQDPLWARVVGRLLAKYFPDVR